MRLFVLLSVASLITAIPFDPDLELSLNSRFAGSSGRASAISESMRDQQRPDDVPTGCVVCKDEVKRYDDFITCPQCSQKFHHGCLDLWMHESTDCPLCKVNLGLGRYRSLVARAQAEGLARHQAHLRGFEEMLGQHQNWLLRSKQLHRRPEDRVYLGPMDGSFEERLTRSEQLAQDHEAALCRLGMVPNHLEHPGEDPVNRGARLERLEHLLHSHQAWLRHSIS
ncbi:hypothetical protein PCANC_15098 [Puccinia coronata f. sp. avenae]|uniref:RING-type domain-containing protein n=1 Tax=Puccinia coronata f. sp. avenae TaxID=200324 RepID=A0A2N5SQV5_9BASI|nr:hypothetical protein PCANC_15098 [Puccinia coronata f. sp. avenae]